MSYAKWTWSCQIFDPTTEDWSASEYFCEGDTVLAAKCVKCDHDLTSYLLRREKRTGQGIPGGGFFRQLVDLQERIAHAE